MKKQAWRRLLGLSVAVTAAVCLVVGLISYFSVRNLAAVVPGQLYRSGQPEGSDWARLSCKYKIRTVINLRTEFDDAQIAREEHDVTDQGMKYVRIPIRKNRTPTPQQVEQFLKVVTDPASHPVLIHCARGRERTGMMIAIYRIRVQGWPLERAMDELVELRKNQPPEVQRQFLLDYAAGQARPASQPDAPGDRTGLVQFGSRTSQGELRATTRTQ